VIEKKFDELRLTGALPSPPTIGLKILEITRSEECDFDELVRTIMADPALSGRLLKLANGAPQTGAAVDSVPRAAVRLGADKVRSLALGFTLLQDELRHAPKAFDHDHYWAQSLATALAANAFALELGTAEPSQAFTCGLLADVGILALASVHPERFMALAQGAPGAAGEQLADLELQAFDIDHYAVAAAMMADWGLPEACRRAVLVHERQRELVSVDDESAGLAHLLRAAKLVAGLLSAKHGVEHPSWSQGLRSLLWQCSRSGIEAHRCLTLCDAIGAAWVEWSRVIGVTCRQPALFGRIPVREVDLQADPGRAAQVPVPIDPSLFQRAVATLELDESLLASAHDAATPTRILLVDDDQRMLKLIAHHLRREGFEVLTAESSETGLQMAMNLSPQIVITDWMMPGMTGVKLCSTLRESDAGRRMYILIVTAREDDEQVVEAFQAGADDYIVKPFNPRILLARVLAGQRMIRMRQKVEATERERLRQVAELGILTRRLRAAAMTDALTDLPNRRYAMKRLKQEWDASLRTGRPLSVVMMDIDHFKAVNDDFGHDVGDLVLREVARALRASSRSADILCRLGGEEFLSINVSCGAEDAIACAERLRAAVEALVIQHPGFDRGITMSLGVAHRRPGVADVDDLIKRADEELYVAKTGGRNCVVFEGLRCTPPERARLSA